MTVITLNADISGFFQEVITDAIRARQVEVTSAASSYLVGRQPGQSRHLIDEFVVDQRPASAKALDDQARDLRPARRVLARDRDERLYRYGCRRLRRRSPMFSIGMPPEVGTKITRLLDDFSSRSTSKYAGSAPPASASYSAAAAAFRAHGGRAEAQKEGDSEEYEPKDELAHGDSRISRDYVKRLGPAPGPFGNGGFCSLRART